jgi:fibronectin-binding autotransporter adhesin
MCREGLSVWMAMALLILGMTVACGTANAQRPLGIDVSSYQGSDDSPPTNINWTKVKSGNITYAWAKATEGTFYKDADFVYNEANAAANGVYIGAYHFAHPDLDPGTAGADTEAAYFLAVAGPYIKTNGPYLVPMLDAEVASPGTQSAVSAWVNEWCQDIVNYGASNGITLRPVVYTYQSWASDYLDSSVTQWPLWMASPNGENSQTGAPSGTSPWSTWTLWQYGGGTISGVEGTCDEDVFNGTATAFTNTLVMGKLSALPPSGVTNLWDPGHKDASPGTGGNGTWDNSTTNWWLTGTGDISWSTAGDYAVFAGTSGTVTLGASVAADSLTFSNGGYVITGSDTLSLNSPGNIVVPTATTNSIECVLGGVAFNLSGGGVLYLNNANNFSDGENVTGPNTTLQVATDHDAGNDGVTLNLKSGGIYADLDATSGDQFLLPGSAVALLTGGGIFENPNGNLTMSNFITGSGSLTIIGTTHTLTLTDTGNNYSGGTIVQAGTLKANAAGTLGSTSGAVTVYGGTLDLGAASHTVGVVTITNGTISDGTLTGSSYAGQGGTISAVLAGSAALTKTTTGTLTLSGINTFTGKTTISSGLLQISADANLGAAPGSPVTNSITLNSGVTTNNYGLRVSASFTLNANRGITLGSSGGQIQVAQNDTLTYGGIITGSGSFESGTGITVGYGTLILSGANSYKGATTIAAGTLRLGANGSLPSGTPLAIASANIGGTFDLNGFSQTIGSLSSSPGINGTGTQSPGILLTGPLTVDETNSTVFAGVISGSGGSFTLNGNSTLTLTGTNTYTGATILSAGTLALATNGSISSSPSISIAAGATFDVSGLASTTYTLGGGETLTASGTGTGIGTTAAVINGAAGGTVSLASQPIMLKFTPTTFNGDTSHPSLYIPQGTLSLNGNPFTINNASGTALGPGTYTVIQQASGSVSPSGTFSVSVTGGGIAPGNVASISVSGGMVNLVVAGATTPVSFSGLSASQSITYGATGITLAGQVSGPGPVYPAMGETVTAAINANAQNTTISDSNGDFSFTYNPSTIPASGTPYVISYSYGGDSSLSAATNTSTTLTVNQRPVALTGTRQYDGTATAAAAILSVTNKVGSDVVTLASGSATLTSGNVGTETITSPGTLALGGAAAGNYTLAGASGAVTVTVSSFSITGGSADVSGSNFILTWQSAPGGVYQVVTSTNITTMLNTWTNAGEPITATNTTTSATNPITSSQSFFDVIGH